MRGDRPLYGWVSLSMDWFGGTTAVPRRLTFEWNAMSMLLTEQERERFAAWLEREAATAKSICEQMENLGPHVAPLVAREKAEAAAALVIARKLRATHSESIG
jgi:hypothetical protein